MKTFMRTESGLKAYKRFHRADFMVYIEGKIKIDEPQDAHDNYKDVKYYTEVLTAASNGKTPKIKCVGNKKSVIDYVKEINKNKIPNSVVIVDKDLEGITSTTLSTPSLIVTVGYSWENELWNINTALSVIDMLTQSNIKALYETKKFLPRIQKRLKILSALDIVLQTNGSKLLKKSTSLGGINFTPPYLKSTEISRIIDKYRETQAFQCDFSKEILKFVIQKNPEEVIQGHLWSNFVISLISHIYKNNADDCNPSKTIIENIALSILKNDLTRIINPQIIAHYRNSLAHNNIH